MEGKTVSRKDVTRRQFSLISWLLPLLCPLLLSFSPPSPPLFITISHLRSIFARFPPPPILSLYTFARLQNRDKNDHTGNGKLSATYDSILLERNIARANACASRIVNLELRDALWIFRFWGGRGGGGEGGERIAKYSFPWNAALLKRFVIYFQYVST